MGRNAPEHRAPRALTASLSRDLLLDSAGALPRGGASLAHVSRTLAASLSRDLLLDSAGARRAGAPHSRTSRMSWASRGPPPPPPPPLSPACAGGRSTELLRARVTPSRRRTRARRGPRTRTRARSRWGGPSRAWGWSLLFSVAGRMRRRGADQRWMIRLAALPFGTAHRDGRRAPLPPRALVCHPDARHPSHTRPSRLLPRHAHARRSSPRPRPIGVFDPPPPCRALEMERPRRVRPARRIT